MSRTARAKTKKTNRAKAAKIVKAIGHARILTAYEEANLSLPKTLLGEFRAAVGLPAQPPKSGSRASAKRFRQIQDTPLGERHKLFYEFWDEYFDFKVEVTELYDESPDWLQAVADEIYSEIDSDL